MRLHPDRGRRADLRAADLTTDVSFFGSQRAILSKSVTPLVGGFEPGMAAGPSADVNLPSAMPTNTQGWISNQSWLESLRYDPVRSQKSSNMEAGVRVRAGIHELDQEWRPKVILDPEKKDSWWNRKGEGFARRMLSEMSNIGGFLLGTPRAFSSQATSSFVTSSAEEDAAHLETLRGLSKAQSQAALSKGGTGSHVPGWLARADAAAEACTWQLSYAAAEVDSSHQRQTGSVVMPHTSTMPPSPTRTRRPSHGSEDRLVALSAPKQRQSQDVHLHDWEVKARQQSIYVAHNPLAAMAASTAPAPAPAPAPAAATPPRLSAHVTSSARAAIDLHSLALRPECGYSTTPERGFYGRRLSKDSMLHNQRIAATAVRSSVSPAATPERRRVCSSSHTGAHTGAHTEMPAAAVPAATPDRRRPSKEVEVTI